MKNLNGIQFSFHRADNDKFREHEVWAHDISETGAPVWDKDADEPKTGVGVLLIHPKTNRIESVRVDPSHQRRGIATEMFNVAIQRLGKEPKHSSDRSDEGDAWARSVGGTLPRRR